MAQNEDYLNRMKALPDITKSQTQRAIEQLERLRRSRSSRRGYNIQRPFEPMTTSNKAAKSSDNPLTS